MLAIYRRELSAYFQSATGYVFLAVYYLLAGFFFYVGPVYAGSTDLSAVFSTIFTITIFIIPILTMRLMSEDKKLKTDQLLITAPVRLSGIVVGKFLAAFTVYFLALSVTLIFNLVMGIFAKVVWATVIGQYVGLLLVGAALIALGLFISSLTESQVIAAVGTFVIVLLLYFADSITSMIPVEFIANFIGGISLYARYSDFELGILNFANVIFFISVAGGFLFLTTRILEKKRWS